MRKTKYDFNMYAIVLLNRFSVSRDQIDYSSSLWMGKIDTAADIKIFMIDNNVSHDQGSIS